MFPGDARKQARVRRLVQEADQYYAIAMEKLVDETLSEPQAMGFGAHRQRPRKARAKCRPQTSRCVQKSKPDLDVEAMTGRRVGAWMSRVETLPYFRGTWPRHWK